MNYISRELKSFLRDVDYYSQGVSLQLQHREKFSTPLGQAFSLAVIFFTFISFGFLTNDLYTYNDPNIVSKVYSDVNPEAYNLNPSTFYIAFGVADFIGFPIVNTDEKTYFNASFKFCETTTTIVNGSVQSIGRCIPIKLIQYDRYVKVFTYFKEKGISKDRYLQALCLDPEDWMSKSTISYISGTPQSQKVSLAVLEISPCDPAAQSNCAQNEEITRQMKKGYISVAFADRLIDQSLPGDPYSYTSKTILTPFSLETETQIKVTLRHSYFKSVQNFFYFSPNEDSYHVLTAANQVEGTLPQTDKKNIIQLSFFLDDKQELYTRNYRTFFDILGSVGGIHSFLKIFLGMIIVPFSKLAQNITLINYVFDIDDKSQKQTKTIPTSSNQVKPYQATIKNDGMIRKRVLRHKQKIKNNCYQMLIMKLCAQDKRKIVNQGIRELKNQLDIANILIKLNEIEHLKRFLLTEEELTLFEYLPRSQLNPIELHGTHSTVQYSEDDDFQKFVETPKNSDKNKQWKVLNSYKQLVSSKEEKDARLLNMLDDKTRTILSESIPEKQPENQLSDQKLTILQQLNPITEKKSE